MERIYQSGADFYRRGPYAPFVEAIRAPSGASVQLTRLCQPAGAFPDPALPQVGLLIMPSRAGAPYVRWDVGTGLRQGTMWPGSMILPPPDTDCDYEVDADHDLLVLNVPRSDAQRLLSPIRQDFTGDFGPLHGPFLADPFLLALAERMWGEAAEDSPRGRLFLEGAVLTLLTALLARAEAVDPDALHGPGEARGLPAWRLKRCLELLHDRLAENLGLDELAQAAGLSTVYFARQFKRATGVAPYQYLLRARIERARTLLASGELPLAEVAHRCGFGGQEQLTRTFRKAVGTTPGAYRRSLRG